MSKSSSLISSSEESKMEMEEGKNQKKQQFQSPNRSGRQQHDRSNKAKKKYSSRSRSLSSLSSERSRSRKKSQSRHQKRKKHHRDSRSRQTSQSSSRSRSHKHKKHKSSKYNDRSNYRDDRRGNGRDRGYNDRRDYRDRSPRDSYDRRDRRDRDRYRSDQRNGVSRNRDYDRNAPRGRERKGQVNNPKKDEKANANGNPLQVPLPLQVPMPSIPGERRKRERSNSPLSYYRRNQTSNQGQFWDSFSWQPRMNYTPNVSTTTLSNTKKMRRMLITNIPYEMGITNQDLKELITRYMMTNYLNDNMNNCPVREVEPNEEDHTVAVELSSVEETCRVTKLDSIELFKGAVNGVVRLGDSCYGNNVITQAQNAAQAQAGVFAAINVLENKKTAFNVEAKIQAGEPISTLLRVTNAVTPYMAQHLSQAQWDEYHEDLLEGFSQYGKIVHNWFVKFSEKDICADPGNLFIEFEAYEEAAKAMDEMQGRVYDERVVKLFYVNREIYYKNFKKDTAMPTIKPPPKGMKIQTLMTELPKISKSSHIASSSN